MSADWETVTLTLIYTKRPKHDTVNYVHVSLTSVGYKVMERFVRNTILAHLQ